MMSRIRYEGLWGFLVRNQVFLDLGAVYSVKILPNHTYDCNLLLYEFYTSVESALKN